MYKVFIDGSSGTTGLRIYDRLLERKDIELIVLDDGKRKDISYRREALNSSDISFLCLPDDAARQAVGLIENPDTVIIDTSTAHRIADGWTYGFAELSGQEEKIKNSKRIANPGCHASGFVSLVAPLVENGIIPETANLSCFSITGYSGGGKKMIEEYNKERTDHFLLSPRQYGINQTHKHLPEMKKYCNLKNDPIFCPIVSDYYAGMEVTVPLFSSEINGNIKDIKSVYKAYYKNGLVKYKDNTDENGFLRANAFASMDNMQISVFGNNERILLVSRFDNLGKGASGSAIQNMNIVMGVPMKTGLIV
ncbi:MAG: N-acetyl-gamma-glutamyl-phosphate reductase [Clostridia bacterium]|nr:N-acetyl-gamma-glutamyl-phosphate reductase [Clostridia bacterium]